MNITIAGSTTNRKYDQDQIESISIELAAFDAEIAVTAFPVPDPAGTDAVVSGRNAQIVDDGTTFLDGFVIAQPRERGPAIAPPHRLTTYSVQDANVLLYGMVANKWVRPAETDVARMTAAAAAFWPTLDTTWLLTTDPVTMTAKTYDTDQLASELSTDTVEATGKTMFVRSAGGTRFLHYHALDEGPTAAISLDSTDGAADYSTIFPFLSPTRDADGLELVYKVTARNAAGVEVTVTDSTSEAAHNADGRAFESLVDFPDAADLTALTALANRNLTEHKAERETFTVEHVGPFTAAQAASIGPGFLISVTSDVLGLTASTQRIAHLTWRYKHPGIWFADMELGAPLRTSAVARGQVGRHAPPVPIIPPGVCHGITDMFTRTVSGDWGTSDAGIAWVNTGGAPDSVDGSRGVLVADNTSYNGEEDFIFPGQSHLQALWQARCDVTIASPGWTKFQVTWLTSGYPTLAGKLEIWFGTPPLTDSMRITDNDGDHWSTSPFYPSTLLWCRTEITSTVFRLKIWADGMSEPALWTFTGTPPSSSPVVEMDVITQTCSSGTAAASMSVYFDDLDISGVNVVVDCPIVGFVGHTYVTVVGTGDDTTTDFTTTTPYVLGTVLTYVGGLARVPTTLDPAAGTFRLSPAPASGLEIVAQWEAAGS